MVRPASFGYNIQTTDNSFQQEINASEEEVLAEFGNMVVKLQEAGIKVTVIDDSPATICPDAVFPNNWFSTSCNRIILYPMYAENRRRERRDDLISLIRNEKEITDLTSGEHEGLFLEGTGSLVLDHLHKTAYAALSNRTHPDLVKEWSNITGYKPVMFTATDAGGNVIYHTNVMMCVGTGYVIVCTEAIENKTDREIVLEEFRKNGQVVIEISREQVAAFAGNMLELEGQERRLLMSLRAYNCLSAQQLEMIKKNAAPLPIPIPTIETVGGGSVRCMVAELF